jgi:replicative DNA helicase
MSGLPAPPDPLDRVPPSNIELEQQLLGAVLINNEALNYTAGLVDAEHFYEPLHQEIFRICTTLVAAGKQATPVTVKTFLPDTKIAGQVTVSQYLARLAAAATSVITAPDYAKTIRSLATLRGLIDAVRDVARTADGYDPDEAARIAFEHLDAVRMGSLSHGAASTSATIGQTAAVVVDNFAAAYQGKPVNLGVPSGIRQLDDVMGGFRRGDLVIGGGRPGMGKTSIAVSLTRTMAAGGYGIGFYSLEMPESQIGPRFMADHLYDSRNNFHLDYRYIIRAKVGDRDVSQDESDKIVTAARDMDELPILMDYSNGPSLGEISAKTRAMMARMKQKFDRTLDMIVIDYSKFMKMGSRYQGNKNLEIGEITGGLKMLARELGINVFLLHQLNRKVEERADKRPQLSDLRDSGEVEQDADVVLFFFREEYYLRKLPESEQCTPENDAKIQRCANKLDIIVDKNRQGPTGTITVHANMGTSSIRALEDERNPPPYQDRI